MNRIVPRTCTEISAKNEDQHREKESRPLEAFRDVPAYVLLGDPGAGKTTAFKSECAELGEKACLITADEFLTYDVSDLPPEWQEKTLFIDGLDEVRAGSQGASEFRELRKRLRALSRFRLSCRQADWLGTYDQERLESVSPDSKVKVLRLDPLTLCDIENILNARSDIPDAHTFIAIAKEQGVDGLLANPLSLDMLAKAVASGRGWPESRKATFEMACRKIVDEHHPGHKETQASKGPPSSDQLLDAAGRLCAAQLISGVVGYTLHGQADEDYPAPDQCDYDSPEALRSALATKLFKGVSNDRFAPVHRHIAEFLGARHLAEVIKSGLPARRIIALIVGEDGSVVTEMRGLSAWLAAHCKDARADLIERDPFGVGLYGDIREFSTDEKCALLESLNREASRLDSAWGMAAAFGTLATPDIESEIKERLSDSNRDRDHQMFTDFVLDVLTEGGPLPNLSELLLEIVRNDTRSSHVKYAALNAFIHNCPDSEDRTSKLKALLADIHTGSLADTDNQLLGTLLTQLYPDDLPPSEVWDYFTDQGAPNLTGRYTMFWEIDLIEKSSDNQVAELLDHLNERLPDLQPVLDVRHLNNLPLKLLASGLKAHGDKLDRQHLYDWINVGFTENQDGSQGYAEEAIREIRFWLEQRPKVHKAVFLEGLSRCPESDGFRWHAFKVQNRLYGTSPPPDFGLWCLKQAVSMADTKPLVAEYLFGRAFNEGLSLKVLQEHTERNETLKAYLDQLLDFRAEENEFEEQHQKRAKKEEQERRQQEVEYVRSNEATLRENRAAPYLLYQIALRYFGDSINFHSPDGPEDIEQELRDPNLIDAARLGIRGVIDREDVPDVEEILALRAKGHRHYICWPFLAGLAEVERTAPEQICQFTESQIRKGLAFHYWLSSSKNPNWYRRLLDFRPDIVSDVLVQSGKSELRSGSDHISGLFALAHDKAHAQVAKHASLPLLRAFPTRCKLKQVEDLGYLLWAAIQHADRSSLQELNKKKLSRKSMNDAQRVHWLAASLIVSPRAYNDLLRDFIQGHERRSLYLAKFFFPDDLVRPSLPELRVEVLELLIRLIGSYAGPDKWYEDGQVTPAKQASRLVHDLIQRLATSPTKDASDALNRLLSESTLSRWHDALSQAQDAQRIIWRDASYRHPTIEQVCQTLYGGTPANPGDLAALVMDRLRELADQIRRGNTDDWRQYWNEPHGQPPTPKHEDRCRDALLSDLRQRLPQGVDAQPEGQYANDTRADIRVLYGDFQVPVEIKKNMHRDLWSALRNQLIAQYTIDPGTDGYGIYLVFWFGEIDGCRTPPPPSGTRPTNAEELQKRLDATLSPAEARKISVCVIDVSRPD